MKRILKKLFRVALACVAVFYAACQCVVHVLLVVLLLVLRVVLAYGAVFVLACRCIGPCLFALRVGLKLKKSGVIQ